jgi:hypothetical protein
MDNFNDLEIRILKILETHQGEGNEIGRLDFVDQINAEMPLFPVSERRVRMVKQHLITQHGVPIGSSGKGYFMAITSQEIEKVCEYFDGYGLNSLFVSSKLRKIEMKEYLGQLSMKFG